MADVATIAQPDQDVAAPPQDTPQQTPQDQTPTPGQTPPAPAPQQEPPSKALWQGLQKMQLYTNSFEDFQKKYSTPESIDSLHQSMQNLQLYTNPKNDFYDKYFPSQKPPPEHQVVHTGIQDVRHLNELANQPMRGVNLSTEPYYDPKATLYEKEDLARNAAFKTQYEQGVKNIATQWGTDPTFTKQAIEDFPDEPNEDKLKGYSQLAATNPVGYSRLKNGNDMRMAIVKSGQPGAIEDANLMNSYYQPAANQDYAAVGNNIAQAQKLLAKYGLNNVYADKLKDVFSPMINTLQPGLQIQHWNSEDQKLSLSDYQYAGLESEKMLDTGKYQRDIEILKHDRGLDVEGGQPIPRGKKGYAYDRGVENVLYGLEMLGRQNTAKYISQRAPELSQQVDALTQKYNDWIKSTKDPAMQQYFQNEYNNEPAVQEWRKVQDGQNALEYAPNEDARKFPLNYSDIVTREVKDAMSQTNGIAGTSAKGFVLGAGEQGQNTFRFVRDTYINLLGSDQAKAENAATIIGTQALQSLASYPGSAFSGEQPAVLIDPKLIKQIQDNFNDPKLSTEEKNANATKLILDNGDLIKVNPNAGAANISAKSVMYSMASGLGQIAGVAAQSMLMGAGESLAATRGVSAVSNLSKAAQVTNAMVPMYTSTQDNMYEQAVARGDANPYLRSTIDATIMTLASSINPDIKVIRKMVGAETGLGKTIAGISEETWNKVLSENKPLYDKMRAGVEATAKQLGISTFQFGVLVPTAEYAVHKNIFNEDPNLGDMVKDGVMQNLITMAIPSLIHGTVGLIKAANVNPAQKWALVMGGYHPKESIDMIDHAVETGQMTPDKAAQMKEVIRMTSDILDKRSEFKSDGKTRMNQRETANAVYDELRKRILEGKLKAASEPQKPALEEQIHAINQNISETHTADADQHKVGLNQLLTENLGQVRRNAPPMEGQIREAVKRNMPEVIFQKIYDEASATKKVGEEEVSQRPEAEKKYGKELVDKAFELNEPKPAKPAEPSVPEKTVTPAPTAGPAPAEGERGPIITPWQPETPEFIQGRHGDSSKDERGVVSSQTQETLSAQGRQDVSETANQLENKGITKVITSDQPRSRETGQIVADQLGVSNIEHRPELNGWNMGDSKTGFDAIKDEEWKQVLPWFVEHPNETVYDGPIEKFKGRKLGESLNDYAMGENRVIPAMERLNAENGRETYVANHSQNMQMYDAYIKNGRQWNDQARQDFLNSEKPKAAALDERSKGLLEGRGEPQVEPQPAAQPQQAAPEPPSRQMKINSLVDEAKAYSNLPNNDARKPVLLNQLRLKAQELGLKVDAAKGFARLLHESGGKVQKREPITNITEIKNFDKSKYSDKTNKVVDEGLKGGHLRDSLTGMVIEGTDGKQLSKVQLDKAVSDMEKGKMTHAGKAIYDAIEKAHSTGIVDLEENGLRAGVPVDEYFNLPSDKRAPAAEIDPHIASIIAGNDITLENLPSLKEELFNGFPYEPEDYERVERALTDSAKGNAEGAPVGSEVAGVQQGEAGTAGPTEPGKPTAGAAPAALTPEAQQLLQSVQAGSKPAFVSMRLEKIAKDNGIEVTGKTTPDDIINQLKAKQDAIQQSGATTVGAYPGGDQGAGGTVEGQGVGQGDQGQAPPGEGGGPGQGQEPPGEAGGPPVAGEEPFSQPFSSIRSGIKRIITDSLRASLDLPPVELNPRDKDYVKLAKGKELVQSGEINPRLVARRVLEQGDKAGIFTPKEAMAMQYYMHQLLTHEEGVRADKFEAEQDLKKDPGDTAAFYAKLTAEQRLGDLGDEIGLATRASRISGNSWSDLGDTMQIEADQNFSPARVEAAIKDNYGGEIPEHVKAKLDQAFAERDAAIAEMKKAKEEYAQKMMEKDAADAEKPPKGESKVAKTIREKKAQLKKERDGLKDDLKAAIKKDSNMLGAMPLPVNTINAISKLALNYFQDGIVTVGGIANRIYEDMREIAEKDEKFNEVFKGIDKNHIREAVASYQPVAKAVATEQAARKAAALEERLSLLEERRKKQRAAGEPEEPMQFDKPYQQAGFTKDDAYIKANQRRINAEFKINQEKRKSLDSKQNIVQKSLGIAARLIRLSVLSGYHVFAKLGAAATIGSAGQKIPEEILNGLWGAAFKGIRDKADTDMGMNLLATLKYYKEFGNLKKLAIDAKDIVTSGETQLGKELEKQHFDHIPILDLPTDMHQIIKSPVKRAMFEYALTKILADQKAKGIDINHPLIMESARQRAFARAKYEIFQEDNAVSRLFGKYESEWKKQGNIGAAKSFLLKFAFPVSKTPTNIARRLGLSVAGVPIGLTKAALAYRRGIENLSTEEANAIGKALTKGSIGIALWMAGAFATKSLGGLYTRFDPNKQRKKGETLADQMITPEGKIPKPWQHALPFEIMQMGATFRHIYDHSKSQKAMTPIALANATMGTAGTIVEQIPGVETPVNLANATSDPYSLKKLGTDLKRRFEPQILQDLGIIKKDTPAK